MVRRLSFLLVLVFSFRVEAAVHVWKGSSSDRFSDAGNWTGGSGNGPGAPPAGDGAAELTFPGGVTRSVLNNDLANLTVRSISFSGSGYVLRGLPVILASEAQIQTSALAANELAFDLILGGGVSILHVQAGDLTFSGAISGAGPVTKRGPGESIFSGTRANTYSGVTRVLEGNLRLAKPDGVRAVPGDLLIDGTGVNNEQGSVSTIANEQIPDTARVHVGAYADFYVGGIETIGAMTLADTAYVITGIPAANYTSTDGTLVITGDISLVAPGYTSNDVTLYGDIAIAGMRTIQMCRECKLRIDDLREATPGSGLVIRGTDNEIVGYDSVKIDGTYHGPTLVEGVRARITNPNTAVRFRSGRFSGSVASLVAEGGRLQLSGGVKTAGDLRLSPAVTVVASSVVLPTTFPSLDAGGVLDLNHAKLEEAPGTPYNRVLGNSYVLAVKRSAGPILGTFNGLPEGDVIANTWRVSYQGGDGNDITVTDVGRFPAGVSLTVAPNRVSPGDKVTLTARITTSAILTGQTGTVAFYEDTALRATVPVVNGLASLELTPPAMGPHTYRAEFSGTPQYQPSTAVAAIEVLPPTPVITSIEPSTIRGGETAVITVRGTDLLPDGDLFISSNGVPFEHISNQELRFTYTDERYEETIDREVRFSQRLYGVSSNTVRLTILANPPDRTRLTFEKRAITGPVVAGGGAAWISDARAVRNGGWIYETRFDLTRDTDNDGIARWEQTADVPPVGIWLMVDTTDGTILSGEPERGTAPPPMSFPEAMFLRDATGAYSYIVLPSRGGGHVMLVRPGVGAWYSLGGDASGRDLDGASNGLWIFRVSSMQAIASTLPAPAGVQPGDVFVSMNPITERWLGDKVDDHLHESDGPGDVRFASSSILINAKENGGPAKITLLRTGGTDGTVSVDYTTVNGTALAGVHYVATAGRATFGPGEILKTIEIPLIDDAVYGGETAFTLALRDPAGTSIADGQPLTVNVIDDDPPPRLSASNVTVNEGDAGTREISWVVSISGATRLPVQASVLGYASYGNPGPIVFYPGGPTSQTVKLTYQANTIPEPNRVITLSLGATNATTADVKGVITIVDDDFAELDVFDATLVEGKSGSVSVSISAGTWKPVTVKYSLISGSATAGSDFPAASGTFTFDRTSGRQIIAIPAVSDGVAEGAETFTVVLSDPVNARIRRGTSTVTIIDAEPTPVITATPLVAWEGADAFFVFRMSAPSAAPVTFRAKTIAGSATPPSDFAAKDAELVTIYAGETTGYLSMKLPSDSAVEGTESFTLALSDPSGATIATPVVTAVILDRDRPPPDAALAAATITDATVTEGNSGMTAARFTVSLASAGSTPLTIAWSTADATATAGTDYVAAAGTLLFLPGETSKTIEVMVAGDTLYEVDETLTLVLSNGKVATGRIVNDDVATPRHRPSG